MKHITSFEEFIVEAKSVDSAYEKIEGLPKGTLFDDAKRIDGIFAKSKYSWSEVIEAFEKNQKEAKPKFVNIKDIKITQPNVQGNKVRGMIQNSDKLKPINVVQFSDELAIYDGHHRLLTDWALGKTRIKVNLVKI